MLTPESHHPTIKTDSPHALKNSVSIGRKGARGEQGIAQAKATATDMEAGVSLDIQSTVDIVRKLVKLEATVDNWRQWGKS